MRWMVLGGALLLGAIALAVGGRALTTAPSNAELQVAAASDLRAALEEIAALYEERTGQRVVLTFGSTGQLTQQIENGAPFDVFLAANVAYVERLRQQGLTLAGSERRYARGRLALVASPHLGRTLERLEDLADASIRHVAIANPDHAPYGLAARQALERAGLWAAVAPKLVYGENVQQALQFVQQGSADAGLVALPLVQRTTLAWVPVDGGLHQPLDQALAVLARAPRADAAQAFAAFVVGPEGQRVLRSYGFEPPGE